MSKMSAEHVSTAWPRRVGIGLAATAGAAICVIAVIGAGMALSDFAVKHWPWIPVVLLAGVAFYFLGKVIERWMETDDDAEEASDGP